MLWQDGIFEAFCAAKRPLATESVFWARCRSCFFLLYVLTFVEVYPIGGRYVVFME